jgi:hypothetical protein
VDACSGTDVARLGASTDHDNLPAHAERDAMPDPDQEAYILRLPVEVLTMIVELAVSGSRKPFHDYYGINRSCTDCGLACNEANARAVCLASCTFRDIAQPMLFRVIDVRSPKAASRIRHTLSKNDRLRKHCRQLTIVNTKKLSGKVFSRWKDILRWSVNVQCVQLHIEWMKGEMCWNLTKKLATHAHHLRHLTLTGEHWYPNSVRLFNVVDLPRLTKLNVDYQGCHDWDPSWEYWRTPLAPNKRRTSPVTSLTIGDENDDPGCALTLIAWPKVLENFTYQRVSGVDKFPTILHALTDSLSMHESTLKSVDISHVMNASHLFDARLFSNLEYLRLSRWHLEDEPLVFTQEYTKILGPRLKILVWNFDDYQHFMDHLHLNDFHENEELWLCELAKAAADSKLQELRIEFTPITDLSHTGPIYPWDRMDKVRDTVMRQIGVSLTYNEPSVSRERRDLREKLFGDGDLTELYYTLGIPTEFDRESVSERELGDEEEIEEVESEVDSEVDSEPGSNDEAEVGSEESEHD